jgi:hypothetical protein
MTIKEVFENKDLIIAQKQNAIKHSDVTTGLISKGSTSKMEGMPSEDISKLNVELVINTCNIIDSHMDCHINGCFKKSTQETKLFYLLQEHEMEFKYIIADSVNDNLTASLKSLKWSDLGYNYKGNTEALVFDSTISKERNEFMFNQYLKGYVLNHSVGMRYIKIFLCINSEEAVYSSEKSNWDNYYPMVVNKEVADDKGYFWAVTEAKFIEGSAVVRGSNQATPTLSVIEQKDIEPSTDTHESKEADNSHNVTLEQKTKISIYNFN